jgi:hypothetical protein
VGEFIAHSRAAWCAPQRARIGSRDPRRC